VLPILPVQSVTYPSGRTAPLSREGRGWAHEPSDPLSEPRLDNDRAAALAVSLVSPRCAVSHFALRATLRGVACQRFPFFFQEHRGMASVSQRNAARHARPSSIILARAAVRTG
jgi:hypothetical protein